MTEEDQHTKEELLLDKIQEELAHKFNLHSESLKGNIVIDEFNGYINTEIKYEDMESLGESLCDWLRQRHDNDFDYDILGLNGHELTIIIL